MGDVRTTAFNPDVKMDFDLIEYRRVLIQLLIDVMLLKPTATGNDVLIVRKPVREVADSAYAVVISIEWSKENPDFTETSRNMNLNILKPMVKRFTDDHIIPKFFPELVGVSNGCNIWLRRFDSAAFIMC